MGEPQDMAPWWRKLTEPAFMWGVLGVVVFYVWTASAERERILNALTDHNNRLLRLEAARQADDAATNGRLVTDAAERADIKATLLAMREMVQRIEAGQRDLADRATRLMQQRGQPQER